MFFSFCSAIGYIPTELLLSTGQTSFWSHSEDGWDSVFTAKISAQYVQSFWEKKEKLTGKVEKKHSYFVDYIICCFFSLIQ